MPVSCLFCGIRSFYCPLPSTYFLFSYSCPSLSHLLYFSMPPCQCTTATFLLATHSSILSFTSAAKSLSNRCSARSRHLPSVCVCVCCVCVIMHMCVKERMWASVPVCASAEKACPRLIAASYLVVTGVIKDDELTVALSRSLSHTHSLSLLAASSLPLWVVFGKDRRMGG